MRINLKDAVDDLAPLPPPCFHNRIAWVHYLKSCAAAQNQIDEPKVITVEGGAPKFNMEFPYCADCTQVRSVEMMAAGRCSPNYLKELAKCPSH